MAQATAIQALSRGYRATGKQRWRKTALDALGAFEQAPPTGVSVRAPGGRHYALYSFAPSHLVFNGGLQAVIGLRDASALLHSKRAKRLFERGERAARREVAEYDTGAWSLYSEHGAEATLNYHSLIAGFLSNLCDRVHKRTYCAAGERFKRYEREPTKIALKRLGKVRWDRASTIRFSISKISTVQGAHLGHARDEPVARHRDGRAACGRCPGARPAAAATRSGSPRRARAARSASSSARSGSRCPSRSPRSTKQPKTPTHDRLKSDAG